MGGVQLVSLTTTKLTTEIENLNKMTKDFDNVQAIYLEENYRSTGAILAASHSIVSQGEFASSPRPNHRQDTHCQEPVHLPSQEHRRYP